MDNEIKEVSPIVAFFSLHTCGESCWTAKEDVCHCYCNGKNHGCLKTSSGVAPTRMAKLDGYMYRLKAIGTYSNISTLAEPINKAAGYKAIDKVSDTLTYHYYWHDTDKGAPARVKKASYDITQKWHEFTALHGKDKNDVYRDGKTYCLWEKI